PTPYLQSNEYFYGSSTRVVLAGAPKGTEIRYTLDGSEPDLDAKLYTQPIKIDKTTVVKMRTFKNGIVQSLCINTVVKKMEYPDPGLAYGLKKGLKYNYYEKKYNSFTEVGEDAPDASGIVSSVTLEIPEMGNGEFALDFTGYLDLPEDGKYTFYLKSDDGSGLYIDGHEAINHDGKHAPTVKSESLTLRAGKLPVHIKYYEVGGGRSLQLSWEGPGFKKQEIPARVLFHKPGN
ncbi:MAG: chitobiase/beta-hexosaminidase C-terminal domain-containing protein, partial [Bacteroidales bacterium]|nr:chitobiase/beta-hexosaminidase C-terminal domain-containing protein [Bacteroidales bacterium]